FFRKSCTAGACFAITTMCPAITATNLTVCGGSRHTQASRPRTTARRARNDSGRKNLHAPSQESDDLRRDAGPSRFDKPLAPRFGRTAPPQAGRKAREGPAQRVGHLPREQGLRSAMRCQAGDIAVITNEYPGCEANIGHLVRVVGDLYHCDEDGWC